MESARDLEPIEEGTDLHETWITKEQLIGGVTEKTREKNLKSMISKMSGNEWVFLEYIDKGFGNSVARFKKKQVNRAQESESKGKDFVRFVRFTFYGALACFLFGILIGIMTEKESERDISIKVINTAESVSISVYLEYLSKRMEESQDYISFMQKNLEVYDDRKIAKDVLKKIYISTEIWRKEFDDLSYGSGISPPKKYSSLKDTWMSVISYVDNIGIDFWHPKYFPSREIRRESFKDLDQASRQIKYYKAEYKKLLSMVESIKSGSFVPPAEGFDLALQRFKEKTASVPGFDKYIVDMRKGLIGGQYEVLEVVVSDFWQLEPYRVRLATARNIGSAWIKYHQSVDKAAIPRIKFFNLTSNEVGGSRILDNKEIWVEQ
ncbi:MAG: hypothetical protein AB8G05_06280 [Oligoflexales bacterium]